MPVLFDEMFTADQQVRAHYQPFHDWLKQQPDNFMASKREEADLIFRRVGITFAVYGDDAGTERLIPFDQIPRIIPAHEWKTLQAGLKQRVRALNMFIHDVYHEQAIIKAGVVPPGWVSNDVFLAGYGAAQVVPGPLFTFAAYLGAAMGPPLGGWAGGLVLLLAIFVPAFLLIVGALPFWEALRHRDGIRRALAGVNAAVVGILGAALYDPVWAGAIHSRADFCLALAAYGLLVVGRVPPVAVVAFCAVLGAVSGVQA